MDERKTVGRRERMKGGKEGGRRDGWRK